MPQTLPLSVNAPAIQWYPGHIAKAEKALNANLAKVDLVIEVRDARIPLATSHPRLQRWISGKQHLLVINRVDMIPPPVRQAWTAWFKAQEQTCWWCDAKAGTGVKQLQQAAIRAGEALNARRAGRGMKPRPVRALMLGFPNVGKSALINRLVRQKVVDSARRAGVTRSLRWVRLGQDLDLLDAPGVLPPGSMISRPPCGWPSVTTSARPPMTTKPPPWRFCSCSPCWRRSRLPGCRPPWWRSATAFHWGRCLAVVPTWRAGWPRRRHATPVATACAWPPSCSTTSAVPASGPLPWSCLHERLR